MEVIIKMTKNNLRALLLDMDGVLWRDTQPIGDLPGNLQRADDLGLQLAFVTNNATRTVEQYLEKFRGFGAEPRPEQIFTTAKATARHLAARYPDGGAVYIIGERGLQEALAELHFHHAESECLAVVAGLDRAFDYEKLQRASLLIHAGAELIGTNPDRTLPSPEGQVPGAGAILAALEAASGAKATIIGKPERALLDAAMEQLGVQASESLMVGDRIETDIAAGQKAGCPTALVLSGVTNRQAAEAWRPTPDYIEEDLAALLEELDR